MIGAGLDWGTATVWVDALSKRYKRVSTANSDLEGRIADELMLVPQELALQFVEPDLLTLNPADGLEPEDDKHNRSKALAYLRDFLATPKSRHADRVKFILADSGMGKTSLLAILNLTYINKFWPSKYKCIPMKLGSDTLERIKEEKNRSATILLLDSLDEDPTAYGRVKSRIEEILRATEGFYRVIITCRNQFLPLGNSRLFPRSDKLKVDGYKIDIRYIAPFSNKQVKLFLTKVFGNPNSFINRKKIREQHESAIKILKRTRGLHCRPLILSYLEDIDFNQNTSNIFHIYSQIVNKWVEREISKRDGAISKLDVFSATLKIARFMTINSTRVVPEKYFKGLLSRNETDLIFHIDGGSKSLLNKNEDGGYRFAHKSFQEFLYAYGLKAGMPFEPHAISDLELLFISQSGYTNLAQASLRGLDLRKVKLRGFNLSGVDFSGMDLKGIDFSDTNLNQANFQESDLTGATLDNSTIQRANFKNAKLEQVSAKEANFTDANLIGCFAKNLDAQRSTFNATYMMRANFADSNFFAAKLYGVHLSKANFERVDFTDCEYLDVNPEGGNFRGAKYPPGRTQISTPPTQEQGKGLHKWRGALRD